MYIAMLRIRLFEERVAELILHEEIKCPTHLYIGQEAVAAGVCASLVRGDFVFSTHRSHGHYLAKGGDLKQLMAELYGKATGCSRGRGGSMHLVSPDVGLAGSSAIVGGTIPLAVGAALAFEMNRKDNVAVAFFGDGAVGEGVFYEALNFASLKRLPVIFVCENNLYSTHMPINACLADTEIFRKAALFNIPGVRVDGNDVAAVYSVARTAVKAARGGKGPTLLECMTYRWRGHVGPHCDLDKGLRSQQELDSWMAKCPVKTLEKKLLKDNIISESEKNEIRQQVTTEVEEAVSFARESPYPETKRDFENDVFEPV